jgi:kynurenine formamidase
VPLIDLSAPIVASPPDWPEPVRTEIAWVDHAAVWVGPAAADAGRARPRARAQDATGVFWAAHQVGLPYCQIERLANLGALPPTGFQVACLPLKVVGGSAGPARVVGIVPDA